MFKTIFGRRNRNRKRKKRKEKEKELLGNECLKLFMEETKICITEKKTSLHLNRTTIIVNGIERGICERKTSRFVTDEGGFPFFYSPSYFVLSFFDLETKRFFFFFFFSFFFFLFSSFLSFFLSLFLDFLIFFFLS